MGRAGPRLSRLARVRHHPRRAAATGRPAPRTARPANQTPPTGFATPYPNRHNTNRFRRDRITSPTNGTYIRSHLHRYWDATPRPAQTGYLSVAGVTQKCGRGYANGRPPGSASLTPAERDVVRLSAARVSGELRAALPDECVDALAAVCRIRTLGDRPALDLHLLFQAVAVGHQQQLFHRSVGLLRRGGELGGQCVSTVQEVGVLDDIGDESPCGRFGRRQRPVGQHQLLRLAEADEPGQVERRATVWTQTRPGVGHRERGGTTGQHQVAGYREAEAGASCGAVDRHDQNG